MPLLMKPECEDCHAALAADGPAFICSYECTFCATCANALNGVCPNCNAELVKRPRRNRSKGATGTAAAPGGT